MAQALGISSSEIHQQILDSLVRELKSRVAVSNKETSLKMVGSLIPHIHHPGICSVVSTILEHSSEVSQDIWHQLASQIGTVPNLDRGLPRSVQQRMWEAEQEIFSVRIKRILEPLTAEMTHDHSFVTMLLNQNLSNSGAPNSYRSTQRSKDETLNSLSTMMGDSETLWGRCLAIVSQLCTKSRMIGQDAILSKIVCQLILMKQRPKSVHDGGMGKLAGLLDRCIGQGTFTPQLTRDIHALLGNFNVHPHHAEVGMCMGDWDVRWLLAHRVLIGIKFENTPSLTELPAQGPLLDLLHVACDSIYFVRATGEVHTPHGSDSHVKAVCQHISDLLSVSHRDELPDNKDRVAAAVTECHAALWLILVFLADRLVGRKDVACEHLAAVLAQTPLTEHRLYFEAVWSTCKVDPIRQRIFLEHVAPLMKQNGFGVF
eukprot:c9426_g1_i2.p1 GENE.c9426_g1_i2~~c9426_g1_i2.p1  ORF type:complete len:430 (+),score=87.86 c9426_g1_i2:164-1453(+)